MRVLLVAIEPEVHQSLETAIGEWGYEVCVADGDPWQLLTSDPRIGLVVCCSDHIDEAALDICRRLRGVTDERPLYIVSLFGTGADGQRAAALAAGADDCLHLDAAREELRERLRVGERWVSRVLAHTPPNDEETDCLHAIAVRSADDGLWSWDLRSDLMHFSAQWLNMIGCEPNDLGRQHADWIERIHPDDRQPVEGALKQHLDGRAARFESECRLRHRDGSYRWMLVRGRAVADASGKPCRVCGLQTDIMDYKAKETLAQHYASHDPLTGLPNRSLFRDQVGRAAARRARGRGYEYSVLFLDLDGFKEVNDTLGHESGDELLRATARRLTSCVRLNDVVGRLGGDEFGVLLDGIGDAPDAVRATARVQNALSEPHHLDGRETYVSASVGIALAAGDTEASEDVLRNADTAMFRAKDRGRGHFQIYDEALHQSSVELAQLEADLREAIDREELEAYFQPIVSLETGLTYGVEALARWQHPQRGFVSPGDFIPLAEQVGLISTIGRQIMRKACRRVHVWQLAFGRTAPPILHVNLSPREFVNEGLVQQVDDALRSTRLSPDTLKLEITEGVVMQDTESTGQVLGRLKDLGIGFHLDDFGTGYSSLSYLHRFAFDALKIDRSFVSRLDVDDESAAIIQTIIGLARDMGMHVIAEGIETEDQLRILRDLQCDYGQGFLFAKALDAEACEAFLRAGTKW